MTRRLLVGLFLAVTIVCPVSVWANVIDWTNLSGYGTMTFPAAVQVTFAPIPGSWDTSYFFTSDPSTFYAIGNGVVANFSAGSTIGIASGYSGTDLLSTTLAHYGSWPTGGPLGFFWGNGPATNINGYADALNNLAANDPATSVYWWFDWSLGGASESTGLVSVEPVPEPGSLFLLGAGLVGLLARRRRAS